MLYFSSPTFVDHNSLLMIFCCAFQILKTEEIPTDVKIEPNQLDVPYTKYAYNKKRYSGLLSPKSALSCSVKFRSVGILSRLRFVLIHE
jgi:hypothetical protein